MNAPVVFQYQRALDAFRREGGSSPLLKRMSELISLLDLTTTLNSSLSGAEILDAALLIVMGQLPATRGALFVRAEGGGYRVLGRLHHQAPKLPFLTSWVSRDKALENLRHAVAVNDRNFVNRHFLAEALADGGSAERAEAVRIEEKLVVDAPSPGHLVEDLPTQEEAKKNLARWKK